MFGKEFLRYSTKSMRINVAWLYPDSTLRILILSNIRITAAEGLSTLLVPLGKMNWIQTLIKNISATNGPKWKGYCAAAFVVLIWSGWLVVSRSGAQSALTIYDLAMLRYGVSSIIALPIVLYFKPWQTMPVERIVLISFLLSPFYVLLVFGGFIFAPAAHGGVFMNGALPAITLILGWLWLSERPVVQQVVGGFLIVIGTGLATIDESPLITADTWIGDLMFFGGALFFSAYMVAGRVWQVSPIQILLCGSLINAIAFFPVWFLFLPSGFQLAGKNELYLQLFYQGLLPNLVGIMCVTYAVRSIGSPATAAFMAAVPAAGTVLSFFLLGEAPGLLGWLSLLPLTIGILLVALARR